MQFISSFIAAGIIFGVLDAIWIGGVANKFYKSQIGKLLRDKPLMPPALVFYVIYLIALIVFVLNPAVAAASWTYALGLGALFGFVCFSTYDLTNYSTIKGFTQKVVLVDIAWGTFATTVTSVITYFIVSALV